MENRFYVYEHIRLDTMKPFYVGKGQGDRAYRHSCRNIYWKRVVKKHGYLIRFVAENLDEDLAFLTEIERIDQLRRLGVDLTNLSDGGEGQSGYSHSTETKAKMSLAHTGRVGPWRGKTMPDYIKQKISTKLAESYATTDRAKRISDKLKNRFFSAEHRSNLSQAMKKVVRSQEHCNNLSKALKGKAAYNKGVTPTDEQIAKQRATILARPKLKCPHCGKETNDGNARRWHFDNCKLRNT